MDRSYPRPIEHADLFESKSFRKRVSRSRLSAICSTLPRLLVGIGLLLVALYFLSSSPDNGTPSLRRIDPTGLTEQTTGEESLPRPKLTDSEDSEGFDEGVDYDYDDVEVRMSAEPIKGLPSLDTYDYDQDTQALVQTVPADRTDAIASPEPLEDKQTKTDTPRQQRSDRIKRDAARIQRFKEFLDNDREEKLVEEEDKVAQWTHGAVTESDLYMTPGDYRLEQAEKRRQAELSKAAPLRWPDRTEQTRSQIRHNAKWPPELYPDSIQAQEQTAETLPEEPRLGEKSAKSNAIL